MSASAVPASAADPSFLAARGLARYRVWDCFSLPSAPTPNGTLEDGLEPIIRLADRLGLERVSPYFHIGMGTLTPGRQPPEAQGRRQILGCFDRWPDRLVGFIMLNPNEPDRCRDEMDRWIKDGPMSGIVFQDAQPASLVSSDTKYDSIVRRAQELGAVIMHYTWFETRGKNHPNESTPVDLAVLARRNPEVTFVSSHAGGEWEKGIRAVYDCPNILVETSGFDPTAGFVDMAVRELGATRIIYGGHLPSRSLATEISKVLGAEIPDEDRFLIFGENLRRLLRPLWTRRGQSIR